VDKVGLDAALFMRFTRMLRSMFACLTVVGCGILIPVNLASKNTAPSGAKYFFLRLTPLYMANGIQAFWAYVVVAYIFNAIICFFLWTNYRAVLRLRRQYLDSQEYQRSLHARTLLMTDIPKDKRTDEGIVRIVEEVKASDALPRAAIARNVKDLPELVEEHEQTVRALEGHLAKYLKNPDKLPAKRPTCKVAKNDKGYTKGQKVDAIEYLTSRIKELELQIKEVRESVDKRNALPYGFASYESIPEAHSTAYVARKGGPEGTIVRLAPRPHDLVWKNLPMSRKQRNWNNMINNLWVTLLTIVWVAPNVLMAVFLSNLGHIGVLWPAFQQTLSAHPKFWAIVQGVVSPAISTAFYFYLPAIFRKLCVNGGDVTKTSRERHVMHKLYSFFLFNNLIIFSLFSAIFGYIVAIVSASKDEGAWQAIKDSHPLQLIVQTLCQVSPYWVSWLLQRNIGTAVDLSQAVTLITASFSRRFLSPTPRQLIELSAPQPFDYAAYYNSFVFYSTVAISIGVLQPLALPVTAFYFFLDSFLKKYLILYVFITKYESGGMFWRTLFNRMLVCTFLGNVVIGFLVATQGMAAVDSVSGNFPGPNWGMLVALIPLPLLLIGFKIYCVRAYDDAIHYYQKGKAMKDSAMLAEGGEQKKKRRGDRVGVRFG
jgi:calcium permeable stress-gated cation channel